jgi:uncharacterized membrane protein
VVGEVWLEQVPVRESPASSIVRQKKIRNKGSLMGKHRLEASSDGVIAILITIMVLELKVPHGATIDALLPVWPIFLSYVLSFIYIGIYWNKLQYGSNPFMAA